jgi:hypothetical protein
MRKHFRFKSLVLGFAFGLAIAAFSASAVQAEPTSGYGPLDPWAYSLIHRSTQANVVPPGKYGPLDPWAYAVIHRSSTGSIVPPDVRDHQLVAQLVAQQQFGSRINGRRLQLGRRGDRRVGLVRRPTLAANGCHTRLAVPTADRSFRSRYRRPRYRRPVGVTGLTPGRAAQRCAGPSRRRARTSRASLRTPAATSPAHATHAPVPAAQAATSLADEPGSRRRTATTGATRWNARARLRLGGSLSSSSPPHHRPSRP